MEISNVQSNGLLNWAAASTPVQSPEAQQERREIVRAVRKLNAAEFYGNRNELQLGVDQATRRNVVRIIDKETREVIQQIPPEYVLRMAEELKTNG